MIRRSTLFVMFVSLCMTFGLLGCGDDSSAPADKTDEITVMTYNILCIFCDKNYDPWEDRITYFADMFERHQPDLVGTQEFFQGKEIPQVLELAPQYSALYYIDDGEGYMEDYPDAAILYRHDRFEVLEEGYYWLGDTPDEPWTGGWAERQFWRLVGWAHFKQKSNGREFVFVNTHFDNNTPNQANSAPLLLNRTAPWAENLPVIVSGDFNSDMDSEAYVTLTTGIDGAGFSLTNAFDVATEWHIDHNQSSEPAYNVDGRIDHIFYAGPGAWECTSWAVDMWIYGPNDMYPSDHWPIVATLRF